MANDIKTLTKNALERDKIFFDEYIKGIRDIKFHAESFGGSIDDLLVAQIDVCIGELRTLKNTLTGAK